MTRRRDGREIEGGGTGKVDETLSHNLQIDQSRLDSYRKIAKSDRSLNERHLIGNSEALKSQVEAAPWSAIGSTRAKLQERPTPGRRPDHAPPRKAQADTGDSQHGTAGVLREQLARESKIVSPYEGKVVDVMMTPTRRSRRGPAVLLRPRPARHRRWRPSLSRRAGQDDPERRYRRDLPDTTRRSEHGFIRGSVKSISEIPATEMAMMAELKHKGLVASFVQQQRETVLLSLHVTLHERGPSSQELGHGTVNRLAWSSKSGASQRVSTGTLCTAAVVVERQPLISLALPWMKRATGTD